MKLSYLLFFSTAALYADEGMLGARIEALESRLARLEKRLDPLLEEARLDCLAEQEKARALERIMHDGDLYSRADLRKIEQAYRAATTNWGSDASGEIVDLLASRYRRANRTGCALLNRAQAVGPTEKETLLKRTIALQNNCYFPNGVRVGAYARLYLGLHLQRSGNKPGAQKLFDEIRDFYPAAIDHEGRRLVEHLDGLETILPRP